MGIFDGILGAGANLLGGILGQNNQEKIAAENIAAQEDFAQHGISWKVADAKSAGINPLAALGASTSSFSNIVGSNDLGEGVSKAGQALDRAASSVFKDNKEQLLKEDLLRAQIANTNSDTIKNQAAASSMATKVQPGTPPGVRVNVPIPTPSPFTRDTIPLFQDFRDGRGGRITMLSKDASESVMNAASLPLALPIGAGLVGRNLNDNASGAGQDLFRSQGDGVRGDVFRGYDNSQYSPF